MEIEEETGRDALVLDALAPGAEPGEESPEAGVRISPEESPITVSASATRWLSSRRFTTP